MIKLLCKDYSRRDWEILKIQLVTAKFRLMTDKEPTGDCRVSQCAKCENYTVCRDIQRAIDYANLKLKEVYE